MPITQSTTLVQLFSSRVALSGDRPAIYLPSNSATAGNGFIAKSWNELAWDVRQYADALQRFGVKRGDRVVQISENRYEWIVTDFAVHSIGAVHVAVHASSSGLQMGYQILDTDARHVIVGSHAIANVLASAAVGWPAEIAFYSHDAVEAVIAGQRVEHFSKVMQARGDAVSNHAAGRAIERAALENVQPDDIATILYSSGTTGEPKGVMLSHGNLTANAIATDAEYEQHAEHMRLVWLPLSHIYARTADLYTWIVRGSEIALAESREKILANCAAVRPTMMNGVPYFYDKIRRLVASQGGSDDEQSARLKQLFGGRMRIACSGGAPLSNGTADWFTRHGLLLVQGYGLTESSPVISSSSSGVNRFGSVGRPVADVEVRIAEDGEVLTRGPHVMLGYWKQPDLTSATVRDGWLYTGDLGQIDDDGFLFITGRKKELIVTAGGKKISPSMIEALLTEEPLIQQAVVFGDGQKYLVALIVPNVERLRAELVSCAPVSELLLLPQVIERYRQAIAKRLAAVGHCEQIGRFALVDRGFTVETGELTASLKLRRSVIAQNFAATIAGLYDSSSTECI